MVAKGNNITRRELEDLVTEQKVAAQTALAQVDRLKELVLEQAKRISALEERLQTGRRCYRELREKFRNLSNNNVA